MTEFTAGRIEEIFSNMNGKKIMVLGDLMIDEYLRGNVSRLSPEAPVPVVEIESESFHFGGAANVALNLKTIGCEPVLIGLVGDDRRGHKFFELLNDNNLSPEGIILADDRPTTVKTRIIGDNQHLARVDREKIVYADGTLSDQVQNRISTLIADVDAIIIEDYNKGLLTKEIIAFALRLANEKGIVSTIDPKFINFLEYKNSTVFKPNIKEAAMALARPIETDEDVLTAGKELISRISAKCVLLTRGSHGLSLFEASGEVSHVPTRSRHVADVSGAGDTVISTMTAAMAGGATLKEAASIANYAAGIVCEEVGIVPVLADDLKRILLKQEV